MPTRLRSKSSAYRRLGFVVSFVPLLGGMAALARNAFGPEGEPMSWRRRAFKAAR